MSIQDLALNPTVGQAASKAPLKNMTRAQAIQYCLDNKLPMALAVGVGDNIALQKEKAQMAAAQQPQKPPVIQAIHQQAEMAMQQHAADQARQGGIADLPVDPGMYSFNKPGMKKGGIVAFDGEDGSYVNSSNTPDSGSTLSKLGQMFNPVAPAAADTRPATPTPTPAAVKPAEPVADFMIAEAKRGPSDEDKKLTTPKPTTKRGAITDVAHAIAPDAAPLAFNTSESAQFTLPKDSPPWLVSLYNDHQNLSRDLAKRAEAYDPGNINDFVAKMSDVNNPRNADTKEFLENLSTQSADALKRKDQAKWMALINFGHGVANANPHAGFLAAVTSGGQQAGAQYTKDLADVRAAQNDVTKNKYMAQQHLQDGAINAYEKQAAKFEMLNDRKYQADTKFQDTMGQVLGGLAHAKIMATQKAYFEPVESQQWRALKQAHPDWTPEQMITAMPKGFAATTSAGARATAAEVAAASAALKNITDPGRDNRALPNDPGHAQWQQEVDHWTSIIQQGGGASAAPSSPQYQEGQTATNPSTGKAMIFHNGQWVAK